MLCDPLDYAAEGEPGTGSEHREGGKSSAGRRAAEASVEPQTDDRRGFSRDSVLTAGCRESVNTLRTFM